MEFQKTASLTRYHEDHTSSDVRCRKYNLPLPFTPSSSHGSKDHLAIIHECTARYWILGCTYAPGSNILLSGATLLHVMRVLFNKTFLDVRDMLAVLLALSHFIFCRMRRRYRPQQKTHHPGSNIASWCSTIPLSCMSNKRLPYFYDASPFTKKSCIFKPIACKTSVTLSPSVHQRLSQHDGDRYLQSIQ